MLGSVAAWWMLSRGTDVRSVIGWSVVPGVIAFVVLAVVLRGVGVRSRGRQTTATRCSCRGRSTLTDDRRLASGVCFWPPVLALTALTFFRLPEALLILRLQDRGVAVAAIPLVWGGLHVVRSLSSYPGGWLSDHLGPRRVVAAGGMLFAVVALLFGTPVSAGPRHPALSGARPCSRIDRVWRARGGCPAGAGTGSAERSDRITRSWAPPRCRPV